MKNLYYIAIEGAIGVGKTSLASLISIELGSRLILEEFDDNPFLGDFYTDPERYAFQTQLFFFTSEVSSATRTAPVRYVSEFIDYRLYVCKGSVVRIT